jgi:hypothetical protein
VAPPSSSHPSPPRTSSPCMVTLLPPIAGPALASALPRRRSLRGHPCQVIAVRGLVALRAGPPRAATPQLYPRTPEPRASLARIVLLLTRLNPPCAPLLSLRAVRLRSGPAPALTHLHRLHLRRACSNACSCPAPALTRCQCPHTPVPASRVLAPSRKRTPAASPTCLGHSARHRAHSRTTTCHGLVLAPHPHAAGASQQLLRLHSPPLGSALLCLLFRVRLGRLAPLLGPPARLEPHRLAPAARALPACAPSRCCLGQPSPEPERPHTPGPEHPNVRRAHALRACACSRSPNRCRRPLCCLLRKGNREREEIRMAALPMGRKGKKGDAKIRKKREERQMDFSKGLYAILENCRGFSIKQNFP